MSSKPDHLAGGHLRSLAGPSHPGGASSVHALRLVESPPYYHEELKLWSGDAEETTHSLHHVFTYQGGLRAELPAFLIRRYSRRGAIVLDPFCGGGTTGLEANMSGRISFLSDANPLAVAITRPKLDPADLTEVTLGLQVLALRRPVEMGPYGEIFKHFFEPETFREIVNLRATLAERDDRVHNFIRLIALSLLHGPSAGYFSVYSYPHVALTPEEQAALNRQRRQVPDYRAIMPRILRKTASALRDGIPSVMRQVSVQNRIVTADARNLAFVATGSVDLTITEPPAPTPENSIRDQWLRFWFMGLQAQPVTERLWRGLEIGAWLDFMNEVLVELARVTRGGGRAAFVVPDVTIVRSVEQLSMHLISMVQQSLGRFWNVECVFVSRERAPAVGVSSRTRRRDAPPAETKVVLLRRK